MVEGILDFLKMNDVEYGCNLLLADLSPIKIGGNARVVVFPNSIEKTIQITNFLINSKTRYKILGRMSNVLPSDNGYDGVVVKMDKCNAFSSIDCMIEVEAGAFLPSVARRAALLGLCGLEEISGIPASIGGAIYQNAGAYGKEICDTLFELKAYDLATRRIVHLDRADCRFGYRSSVFHNGGLIILSAKFLLSHTDSTEAMLKIKKYSSLRRSSQPTDRLSLGSTFLRMSNGESVARLIDKLGLKGFYIGGAQISEKHAGFIINLGNATAKDYLSLSEYVQEAVYEHYGIRPEREIEIL